MTTVRGTVDVFPTPDELAVAAADRFVAAAAAAIDATETFTVALSGGSTPRALFMLLASETYAPRA